jgi:hypothetical protein
MPKYLLIGASQATDGRDEDYARWYDQTHIRDICALPGVSSGKRYEATEAGLTPVPARHLAIYEVETDDIDAVMAELRRRSAAGEIAMTDAIDLTSSQLWIYQAT